MNKVANVVLALIGILLVVEVTVVVTRHYSKADETVASDVSQTPTRSYKCDTVNSAPVETTKETARSIEEIRSAFQESFAPYGVVRYEPTARNFVLDNTNNNLSAVISAYNTAEVESNKWTVLVSKLSVISVEATKQLGTGYTFLLLNNDNAVLVITDGQVMKNITSD